jgi:hypothetical protein
VPAGEQVTRCPSRVASIAEAFATDNPIRWVVPTPFNLQRRAVRHPSQSSYVACHDLLPVALFLSMEFAKFSPQAGGKKA